MMVTLNSTLKHKFSIEDVDALTGTLIGRPKSATYRTADVVGLDTLAFVAKTGYDKCLDDSERDIFQIPEFLSKMLENKWLGQKSGQGFYKKIDKGVIHSLDLETLEYIHLHKTGALLKACVTCAAFIGGADEKLLEALSVYARGIGLAFQIIDDILDVTASSEVLGKTAGKDLIADKTTYPKLLGLDESRRRADLLVAKAKNALDPWPEKSKPLLALADYITNRDR